MVSFSLGASPISQQVSLNLWHCFTVNRRRDDRKRQSSWFRSSVERRRDAREAATHASEEAAVLRELNRITPRYLRPVPLGTQIKQILIGLGKISQIISYLF